MNPKVSKDFYTTFFNETLDGLAYCQILFDEQGNPIDFIYIKVNKKFEELTGLKKVEGKKATELVFITNTINSELIEIYSQVSLTGKSRRFEMNIGIYSKCFLISVYSSQKNFFVSIFQDITDQKNIEKNLEDAKKAAANVLEDLQTEKEMLAHAKAKDEALLESIGEGMIAVDIDKKVLLINKVAEKMIGWSGKELISKELTNLPLEDEAGNLIPSNKRPTTLALETGKTVKVDYFFVRKDKSKFLMAITVTPIKLNRKIIGLIEIIRDVTHEKEIDKAKSEFVSLASHQLRTPLTTVSWYTEMILKGDVGKVLPRQKKYLKEIYQGNKRMIDLVNTLLDVSRIELGTFRAEPIETNIITLAKSILDEQKLEIKKKGLIIVENFSKDIPTFSIDPKLLRMVFQNLLTNAVGYTPPKGKIEFSISLENKNICIKVSDTGYGIPKNQQNQIFTKLFRADNVRDKDTDGTGLGLYIVKSIVENSGGKIWFESEENKGTIFYITFPLKKVKGEEDKK